MFRLRRIRAYLLTVVPLSFPSDGLSPRDLTCSESEFTCFNWFKHVFPYVNSQDCVDKLGVPTPVLTGSKHVKSHVSIDMLTYVNLRDCVDKLIIQTRVLSGSEHVKSRVSTGSIHVLPYVNSRDSVHKFHVQTRVLTG